MGKYVAENTIKSLIKADIPIKNARIGVLGLTFKENCPDTRNSKVVDIINELKEYGIGIVVCDPVADKNEAIRIYGIDIEPKIDLVDLDAIIVAVAHEEFKSLSISDFSGMYKVGLSGKVLIDIKGIYSKEEFISNNFVYWRL